MEKNSLPQPKLQNIKLIAERKNTTLRDLAATAEITEAGLYKIIKSGNASSQTIVKLAVALKVPVHWFFYDLEKVSDMDFDIGSRYIELRERHKGVVKERDELKVKVDELQRLVIDLQSKLLKKK